MQKTIFFLLILLTSCVLSAQSKFAFKVLSINTFKPMPDPIVRLSDKTILGDRNGEFIIEPADSGIIQLMVIIQGCYPVYIKNLDLKKYSHAELYIVEDSKNMQYGRGSVNPVTNPADTVKLVNKTIPETQKSNKPPYIEIFDKKGSNERYYLVFDENFSRAETSKYEVIISDNKNK